MDDDEIDNKETINRILQTLDPWTLRVSLLELNLMFKQAKSNAVSDIYHSKPDRRVITNTKIRYQYCSYKV